MKRWENAQIDPRTEENWISCHWKYSALMQATEFLNIFIRNGEDITLLSTDLSSVSETKESLETSKSNMQDFPKTDKVLKLDRDKVKFCIKFKPELLKKLAFVVDGLSESKGDSITFLFTGQNDIAHLLFEVGQDKQGAGAIMPLKSTEDIDAAVASYNKALSPEIEEEEKEEIEAEIEKELVAA